MKQYGSPDERCGSYTLVQRTFGATGYVKAVPGPELRPYVAYVWLIDHADPAGQLQPDLHVPDGLTEIVFVLRGSYSVRGVTAAAPESGVERSCLIGLQNDASLVKGHADFRMVGIKLTPRGFYRFLGRGACEVADGRVAFADWRAGRLGELEEELAAQRDRSGILAAVDRVLHDSMGSHTEGTGLAATLAAAEYIERRCGMLTVEDLAYEHNLGVRQLQRRFREYLRMTPKQLIGLTRFRHYYRAGLLNGGEQPHYLDYGYYDQAHFIKDFRSRAGITPTQAAAPAYRGRNRIAAVNLV